MRERRRIPSRLNPACHRFPSIACPSPHYCRSRDSSACVLRGPSDPRRYDVTLQTTAIYDNPLSCLDRRSYDTLWVWILNKRVIRDPASFATTRDLCTDQMCRS